MDSTDDLVDAKRGDGVCAASGGACTLRAAIQESNALAGADNVVVPSGRFVIKLTGRGEDDSATGDLDISSDITLTGSSTGMTNLLGADGTVGSVDRLFDVIGPAVVTIARVVMQKGSAENEDGGAVRNDATLSLQNVAIVSNQAKNGSGGGIANINRGTLRMVNVTLSANVAAAMSGGGLANFEHATSELNNVSVVGNSAQTGGGIYNLGTVELHNTVVADNTLGGNCAGKVIDSLGHNLDSESTCVLGPGELSNTEAKLGPLTNYGGGTLAHEPTRESPALDAGDNTDCPAVDQRLFPRPVDVDLDGLAACDIGALEYQPVGTPTITPSRTPTATGTASPVPSPSQSATATRTGSATATATVTLTASGTATPTVTPSRTATLSAAGSPTQSPTPTVSATATGTPSATAPPASPTPSTTNTPSGTPTQSPTHTGVPSTPSRTRTPTETPLRAAMQLDSGSGVPGADVTLSATLMTAGLKIAAAQGDLVVDGVNLTFVSRPGGLPDCVLGPQLAGLVPSFTFVPANCQPNCTMLRAGVFDLTAPISTIPDGAELFACKVHINSGAALGIQNVGLTRLQMSDPRGLPVQDVVGYGGIVVVVAPTSTPTDTPTQTSTPTATGTETRTPSPTLSPTVSATATQSSTATFTQSAAPTSTPTQAPCVGDCGLDGSVTVEELVLMVNVALGTAPVQRCLPGDRSGDGQITIEEILRAVNNALGGCR